MEFCRASLSIPSGVACGLDDCQRLWPLHGDWAVVRGSASLPISVASWRSEWFERSPEERRVCASRIASSMRASGI